MQVKRGRMSKENNGNKDPMQEVLAAVGAWTMHNCQGNAEMADEIFRCVVPKFQDRYPHHKLLTHLCQEARPPLLVTTDSPLLTVYMVANQLSVKLPSGEVLLDEDPITLADMLSERGFCSDDVACADWREGDRAPMVGHAIALKARLQEIEAVQLSQEMRNP